jgi:hypothetical protein
MSKTPKTPAAPKGAVKQSAAAPQTNALPSPFGKPPAAPASAPPAPGGHGTATAAPLRQDGPTLAEYVAAGYSAETYPPRGYAAKPERAGEPHGHPPIDGIGDPAPAGETGRELTGSEVADAAAAVLEKKNAPKRLCPNCTGLGTVAQGNGRTRCTVCDGAGEIART